jgi:hypothetical protein
MVETAITDKYINSVDQKENTKKMEPVITYSDWGIAATYILDDIPHIRLNRNLLKWKSLYSEVLEHEKKHIEEYKKKGSLLNTETLFRDLIEPIKPYNFFLALFCIRYPKTIAELLPIKRESDLIYFNPLAILVYALLFLLFISIYAF